MKNATEPVNNIAHAIRFVRKSKGLSQEDFGLTSSRTYVSTLERGMKSPTLSKLDDLSKVMNVHPLTLLVLSYVEDQNPTTINALLERVGREITSLK
jgi:transcriptional regulator with XRE-family HTH domain